MTTPEGAAAQDGEWQRLHPLSPLLRGGVVLLAALGYVVTQLTEQVLGSVDVGIGPSGGDADPDRGPFDAAVAHPLLALALLVLVLAVVGVVSWVSWRFSRFRVGGGQVELRTGVLFRQHRQVPLERVQAVELSRPLLARALGLAKVVVQSAGGSDAHLTLAFVSLPRAEALRLHLLDLAGTGDEVPADGSGAPVPPDVAAGADPTLGAGPGAAVPPARPDHGDGVPVVAVPNGRLFVATILHGSTVVLGALALVVAGGAGSTGRLVLLAVGAPALLPVVFGVVLSRARELLTHGNFSLARTPTALRVRHGLTDLRMATVPVHRVQAVEVLQPLWWRPWGWWRVRVNVAGVQHGGDGERQTETTLLPVGTLDEALRVLAVLGAEPGDGRLVEALTGAGDEDGWVHLPAAARLLDPLGWRRGGYVLTRHAVLVRRGRLTRRAVVVPHARVQSLTLRQGPLQASRDLATAHVVSTPGPVSAHVAHLRTADAHRFLEAVAARAGVARRAAPVRPTATRGVPSVDAGAADLAPPAPPLVN